MRKYNKKDSFIIFSPAKKLGKFIILFFYRGTVPKIYDSFRACHTEIRRNFFTSKQDTYFAFTRLPEIFRMLSGDSPLSS